MDTEDEPTYLIGPNVKNQGVVSVVHLALAQGVSVDASMGTNSTYVSRGMVLLVKLILSSHVHRSNSPH